MDVDVDVEEGFVNERIGDEAMLQSDIDEALRRGANPVFLRPGEQSRKESGEREAQQLDKGGFSDFGDGLACRSIPPGYSVNKILTPGMWRSHYDIFLCGRLGLYCYNFQKGTNYEFVFVSKYIDDDISRYGSFAKFFIVLEVWNPADNSRFIMKTKVRHGNHLEESVSLWWETRFCLEEDSPEEDHECDNEAIDDNYEDMQEEDDEWDNEEDPESDNEAIDDNYQGIEEKEDEKWDNEAIDDQYKGEMPKWLSDVDKQQCYVVEESELKDPDNDWLELFAEFAFYSMYIKRCKCFEIAECLPLEIEEVIVETRGEADQTEPREKLKAANAIFYMSFECRDDPLEGNHVHYRAVVRKTMDGKPGHVRLEVSCWTVGA